MTATAAIVRGVKARLRARGLTYRDLARRIGVSEPTVKRDLARGNFTLERLDRICDALECDVTELLVDREGSKLTELTAVQERALVAEPRLLLLTYLLVNDWTVSEVLATFRLTENELVNLLLKLDALRIVDFRPPRRIRRLTARNFSWRKDGPVHAYLIRRVIPEFFASRFDAPGDEFHFVGGTLTETSRTRLRSALQRVVAEFEDLAHHDARLPLEQRDGCTAIVAFRQWEYSEFSKLRRSPRSRGASPGR